MGIDFRHPSPHRYSYRLDRYIEIDTGRRTPLSLYYSTGAVQAGTTQALYRR